MKIYAARAAPIMGTHVVSQHGLQYGREKRLEKFIESFDLARRKLYLQNNTTLFISSLSAPQKLPFLKANTVNGKSSKLNNEKVHRAFRIIDGIQN